MSRDLESELIINTNVLLASTKGILGADESVGSLGRRFESVGIENTEENRRKYRELLISTPGLSKYISGFIFSDEAIHQMTEDGINFIDLVKHQRIIPGVRVDKGFKPLYGTASEIVTQGLDDLDLRCAQYYSLGIRFAKWRSVFHIRDSEGMTPSELSIHENCRNLARFAAICQANDLVPMIEPEVLMNHQFSIEVSEQATRKVLIGCFEALLEHHVRLDSMILKTNMIRPGSLTHSNVPFSSLQEMISHKTLGCLLATVPRSVPGIAFLSGGMSEEEATRVLNAINLPCYHKCELLGQGKPWELTFSFGRALQDSCLHAWKGKDCNVDQAQDLLLKRAKLNSDARQGRFIDEEMV